MHCREFRFWTLWLLFLKFSALKINQQIGQRIILLLNSA
jgi:hypothetical protein